MRHHGPGILIIIHLEANFPGIIKIHHIDQEAQVLILSKEEISVESSVLIVPDLAI